jgi:hypothetical protein
MRVHVGIDVRRHEQRVLEQQHLRRQPDGALGCGRRRECARAERRRASTRAAVCARRNVIKCDIKQYFYSSADNATLKKVFASKYIF